MENIDTEYLQVEEMVEKIQKEFEDKHEPWPSNEEYLSLKKSTIGKYKPCFSNFITNNQSAFPDLNSDQIDSAANVMAHFVLGVRMVYRRLGNKYNDINISFSKEGISDNGIFGNEPGGAFWVSTKELASLVKRTSTNGIVDGDMGGMMYPSLLGVSEIAGVEEAAHKEFVEQNKGTGKKGVEDQGLGYEYHTSEIEYDGLLWKSSYAKKYNIDLGMSTLDFSLEQSTWARHKAGMDGEVK